MARQDRWPPPGYEKPGAKTGAPGSAPEQPLADMQPAADIEHTQPMERTEDLAADPAEDTTYLGAPLPRIEQLPPGIIVKEDVMGRATGQWIVQIRCECGRRWFDVEMVKTARCPRCENMVVVEPIV